MFTELHSSGKNMAVSPLNMEMHSICTNPSSLQMFIFIHGFAIIFAVSFTYRSVDICIFLMNVVSRI